MEPKPKKFYNIRSSVTKNLLIIFALVLTGFGILLGRSYKELNLSIQDERVKSVEQMGVLLSDKVTQLKNVYISDTEQLANILTGSDIRTKEALRNIFRDGEQFLFVTSDGMFVALDGTNWLIEDDSLRDNVLNGVGVESSFASEETKGDYWLFSKGIPPVSLDGQEIIGVVKPVSTKEYADVATQSLFDGMGAAYVVDNNGVIIMRPESSDTPDEFEGYNLFSILAHENVKEKSIEELQTSIKEQSKYQIIAEIGETIWLIQSVPGDYGRGIIITVPISITAKDTYSGMRQVIFLIVLVVFSLAMIVILCIRYILRKNQLAALAELKIKAKNDFLDKMSHDIRTPLNAIVGMHELALRSLDDKEALEDYLNKAKSSSEYLISVINDILDMSKIENGKMKISQVPFNMEELLNHVYQMEILAAQSKNLHFTLDIHGSADTDYIGDPVRIRQCLMNLVSNAVKFTREGGSIMVSYRSDILESGRCLVTLEVKDTGIGMSDDFRTQMFKPFEQEYSSMTSSYPGSGLGLAIVGNLIELMGGAIQVTSKLGEGSTFTIRLPLERSVIVQEKITERSETELMEQLRGKRILFVEDNELNREIGVSLLEQFNLKVEQVENGREAVDAFERSPAGYYSLIFMDIQMPVMNGYEAAKSIRLSGHPDSSTIPILALSANAFDEDARKSVDAGMQGHLAKPIDMVELMSALKKHIK